MLKKTAIALALGLSLLFAAPALAGGPKHYGAYHGGPKHYGYYGGYGHRHYAPYAYRPRVVYSSPYIVAPPVVYPPCDHYPHGGSFYIQGRNFSFGIGY